MASHFVSGATTSKARVSPPSSLVGMSVLPNSSLSHPACPMGLCWQLLRLYLDPANPHA